MLVRWSVVVALYLAPCVAPSAAVAQSATPAPLMEVAAPVPPQRFAHKKKLVASYDSVANATHLAVVTHKGRYFLTIQRPRLTWSVVFPGQVSGSEPPTAVTLEFRTQAPEVALDSRLTVDYGDGGSFEVPSAGAFSDPGVQTWSHYMRFPIPCRTLGAALASERMTVTVGGIVVRFKPDEVNALRDLLARVGAWPPVETDGG